VQAVEVQQQVLLEQQCHVSRVLDSGRQQKPFDAAGNGVGGLEEHQIPRGELELGVAHQHVAQEVQRHA